MFFVYHQHVVPCLDILIYHLTKKIIRWQSTYHSTQLNLKGWTFHHWSSDYGNIWRTFGTRPRCKNHLTYLQFLLLTYMNTWSNGQVIPFAICDASVDNAASIWILLSHTGVYVMAIGSLISTGLGIICCYFFWCWPARLVCWPLLSGSVWHTIVDVDVDAAPIYRCDSKARQPIRRPCKNHDLCMKWEPTQMESPQKQQASLKAVPKHTRSLDQTQNPGNVISTHGLL